MENSKFTNTLKIGLGLAAGLTIGNAIVWPLISNRTISEGFVVGVISGLLTLAIYVFIAIAQNRNDTEQ